MPYPKGRPKSEEAKRKISEGRKGIRMPREAVERIRQKNLGKHHSEETKEKMRLAHKGTKMPPLTTEARANRAEAQRKVLLERRTTAELLFAEELRARGIAFVEQYVVSPYIVDFYLPEQQIIIELSGTRSFKESKSFSEKKRTVFIAMTTHCAVRRIHNSLVQMNPMVAVMAALEE